MSLSLHHLLLNLVLFGRMSFVFGNIYISPIPCLYGVALRGTPVRCEECDGIMESRGLSPPITKQSGLVLISSENTRLEMMQKTAGCPQGPTS